MEQSPSSEAKSHLANHGTRRFVTMFTRPHFTGLCLEPDGSSRHRPPSFPKIHSYIVFPSTPRSSEWTHSFRFSDQNTVCISHQPHAYYMTRPFHSPWFHHPNNVWWSVQAMKLLIMQSSPTSPQHPVLKHLQSQLLPQCDRDQVSHPYKTTGEL